MSLAACENIHKTYLLGVEGVPALRGVSVDVRKGEFLVVFGTSGGGKSTMLNVLGTIDVPTKGNLMLMDTRITDRTPDADLARLRCRHVGFVFQSFNLIATMTALENVTLPMVIAGDRSRDEITRCARDLLISVGLEHRINHYPSMLSGGEQQRVTIARSLANDPDLLLLDEPTGDLDTKNSHIVMNILLRLNRTRGLTMVMVTHDVYMKPFADRVLYMRDGKVGHIEEVDQTVKEQTYKNLVAQVEGKDFALGEHDTSDKSPTNILVRRPRDYATHKAQRSLAEADPEMIKAVETLFGSRSFT